MEVVIAGILHDLLEDTKTEKQEIKAEFGEKVAQLVAANSFDKSIKNHQERYKEMFKRCRKQGKEALLIKAADILDNSNYYQLAEDEEAEQRLWEKMGYFIKVSKEIIDDERVWQELRDRNERMRNEK